MKTHTFSPAGWHSHRSTRQIWKSQTEKGITVQEADKNFTISDYSSVSALQQAPNSCLFVFKHWILLYGKGTLIFLEPQHCHCLTLHSQIQSFYGFYEPSMNLLLWTFYELSSTNLILYHNYSLFHLFINKGPRFLVTYSFYIYFISRSEFQEPGSLLAYIVRTQVNGDVTIVCKKRL